MSLMPQLDRYLSVRRSLGYDLRTSERSLRRFTSYADAEGAAHIGTALFLRWHATLADANGSTRATRLRVVRLFAQWLSGFDPAHEVPPQGLLPDSSNRPRPHIYTTAEIAEIVAAARELPSVYGLRGHTCSTLFGLIAVTGLRISEALALDRDDLDQGVLRVRRGKLGRERLLPLDPGVVAHMGAYLTERDRLIGHAAKPLFVTDKATRLPEGATVRIEPTRLEATQADRIVDAIARANGGRYSVDLHLRHDPNASEAFATSHVRRLEAMRRAGAGPERLADGSWTISDDHLAQAEAYPRHQRRARCRKLCGARGRWNSQDQHRTAQPESGHAQAGRSSERSARRYLWSQRGSGRDRDDHSQTWRSP